MDYCVECGHEFGNRQLIRCDVCPCGVHRLCGTDVSQRDYRRMMKGEIVIPFVCNPCRDRPRSWHRRLNGKAGRSLLHFYLLVPLLRKEARFVDIQIQLIDEQAVSRQQRRTYRNLQGKLEELWDKYEKKSMKTSEFLYEVGYMYAPTD